MVETRDWKPMQEMSARLLKERTGDDLETWVRRIEREHFDNEGQLRTWLSKRGVSGYAQTLLVMEQFGYPDFLLATSEELIEG